MDLKYSCINNRISKIFESEKFLGLADINSLKFSAPNIKWLKGHIDLNGEDKVHHEEYYGLKNFNNQNEIVLDIGANWGYSVLSMRNCGVASRIISFEVNPIFDSHLNLLRSNDIRNDYFIIGLSDFKERQTFIIPVIKKNLLSGCCSPLNDRSIDTISRIIKNYDKEEFKENDIEVLRFESKCSTLDDLEKKNVRNLFSGRIVAMKLDVEGHELNVLKGARRTISLNRPLILIEGANRNDEITKFLSNFNYNYFDFSGDNFIFKEVKSTSLNGFFIHEGSDYIDTFR